MFGREKLFSEAAKKEPGPDLHKKLTAEERKNALKDITDEKTAKKVPGVKGLYLQITADGNPKYIITEFNEKTIEKEITWHNLSKVEKEDAEEGFKLAA